MVGQPTRRVVEEEVRRTGRRESPADCLLGIQQVRECPRSAPRLISQSLGPIVRICLRIVGANAHRCEVWVPRNYSAQLGLDVSDVRAVVAQKCHQQRRRGSEIIEAHLGAG